MEPQFRFCTSADGTRIAYAVYGSGPPLVYLPSYFLSMDARFTLPEARAYFDALAARTTLVTYDRRGCGASARDVDDISREAEGRDIAAVADAAGLSAYTLLTESPFFVARQERRERIILWVPFVAFQGWEMARAAREDWSYARRVFAGRLFPDGPVSLQRAYSRAVKDSVSAEAAARHWEALADFDLDALLPAVTAPALVLLRDGLTALRQGTMRVAGLMPNSQLRFVAGSAGVPYPGHEPVVEAVFEFMGLREPASATPADVGAAIILFADIADSTALTERLGDTAFREKARALDEALRRAISWNGGTAIDGKLLGDGVLATFGAAREAIACAAACHDAGSHAGLPLHVGIHAGDVIREDNNVYGGAVNIAARVAGEAAAGETLVSATVRDLARTSAGVSFEDRGERELKGVGEPVRVWAVREA